MFTLYGHGPAAGRARELGMFPNVASAEDCLNKSPSPVDEGAALYLVNEDGTQIWALTIIGTIDSGVEKFYDASHESWAKEQIKLLRSTLPGHMSLTLEERNMLP